MGCRIYRAFVIRNILDDPKSGMAVTIFGDSISMILWMHMFSFFPFSPMTSQCLCYTSEKVKSCSAKKIMTVPGIGLVTLSLVNGDTNTAN